MQHEARLIQLSALEGPHKVVIKFVLFHLLLLRASLRRTMVLHSSVIEPSNGMLTLSCAPKFCARV